MATPGVQGGIQGHARPPTVPHDRLHCCVPAHVATVIGIMQLVQDVLLNVVIRPNKHLPVMFALPDLHAIFQAPATQTAFLTQPRVAAIGCSYSLDKRQQVMAQHHSQYPTQVQLRAQG